MDLALSRSFDFAAARRRVIEEGGIGSIGFGLADMGTVRSVFWPGNHDIDAPSDWYAHFSLTRLFYGDYKVRIHATHTGGN